MANTQTISRTREAEQFLEKLAESLQVPESRYKAAIRSYESVGKWLDRGNSRFSKYRSSIYPQGSFALGTVIRPHNRGEEYDLDVAYEIDIDKTQITQQKLKENVGRELTAYSEDRQLDEPKEKQRCWRLEYADEAQFHMDIVPALSDGVRQKVLIETATRAAASYAGTAVVITDNEHSDYSRISLNWNSSNPKGYVEWFKSRMRTAFDSQRRRMMIAEARADIAEIPEYRVRTPLQSAIQILKRHRDVMFEDRPDDKPISVIITTLAARSYNQETTIADALYAILSNMESHIKVVDGVHHIENPTDPRENFADKWIKHPERKDAFFEWLGAAKADFGAAGRISNSAEIVDVLAPRMGRDLVESVVKKVPSRGTFLATANAAYREAIRRLLDAPHRLPPTWTVVPTNYKVDVTAQHEQNGFKVVNYSSDGPNLPPKGKLIFEAHTNVPAPRQIYWQVTNTGAAAKARNDLRGGFIEGRMERGGLTRSESLRYLGTHSVECFIVKDGVCVAKSGLFVVNIGS